MKKMKKAGIVMLSAGVLGGVAPAVAPSVLNLNGGVVYAAEETHKVTINYDLYDDPMLPFSSSSSSKVFDVTPNQPLSDHIPKTLPGGYVFAGGRANSGGSEGSSLEYNDPFGNWTNFHVTYVLKPKKSRTNLSNAGTNNNADTEVKPNNGDTNAGTNNNASTEVKPNNGNTNSGNNNSNVVTPENNTNPSDNIINNIFSNDAFGVKVTLTDKTNTAKLSVTPVEDKALTTTVLEKLNLPADNQIRILDLKLLDKNNTVVDSNSKRTVAIVLKEGEKDVAIYHIKDNGELELIDSTTKDGVVTFEIDHFSKFAIVSNTNKPSNSPSENSTSNNVNKLLPKTGLTNSNLASLVTLGLILSGAAIFSRRKNRR